MSAPSTTATNQTGSLRMLDALRHGLRTARRVDVAVSFTRFSGLSLLWDDLSRFLDRGGAIRLLTSTYLCVTQPEVLQVLVDKLSRDRVRVFDASQPGFHAKVFLFGDGAETASELPTELPDLVSCGTVADGHALAVRDPETGAPVPDDTVGAIGLAGPSVTTAGWLATGDLGRVRDGHLYVVGRDAARRH